MVPPKVMQKSEILFLSIVLISYNIWGLIHQSNWDDSDMHLIWAAKQESTQSRIYIIRKWTIS